MIIGYDNKLDITTVFIGANNVVINSFHCNWFLLMAFAFDRSQNDKLYIFGTNMQRCTADWKNRFRHIRMSFAMPLTIYYLSVYRNARFIFSRLHKHNERINWIKQNFGRSFIMWNMLHLKVLEKFMKLEISKFV